MGLRAELYAWQDTLSHFTMASDRSSFMSLSSDGKKIEGLPLTDWIAQHKARAKEKKSSGFNALSYWASVYNVARADQLFEQEQPEAGIAYVNRVIEATPVLNAMQQHLPEDAKMETIARHNNAFPTPLRIHDYLADRFADDGCLRISSEVNFIVNDRGNLASYGFGTLDFRHISDHLPIGRAFEEYREMASRGQIIVDRVSPSATAVLNSPAMIPYFLFSSFVLQGSRAHLQWSRR